MSRDSNYPEAYDDDLPRPDPSDPTNSPSLADAIARLSDAIYSIQNELGLEPSSRYDSVKRRFDVNIDVNVIEESGSSVTLDNKSYYTHDVTLTDDCEIEFDNPVEDEKMANVTLILRQDENGGHTPSWSGNIVWQDGAEPAMDTEPESISLWSFMTVDNGDTWFGFLSGDRFL